MKSTISPRRSEGGLPAATGKPPGAATPPKQRRLAYGFICAVFLAAGLIGWLHRSALIEPGGVARLAPWLLATVLAELFWLPTVTGRATSSMASTVNFAALFILGPEGAVWVAAIAAGLATFLFQRRSLLRSLYNLAQIMLTVAAAGWFDVHSGGGGVTLEEFRDPSAVVHFISAGLVYIIVNTGLVAAVVAFWEGQPFLRVWQENYGYLDDFLTSLALFLLSPLMVLSYLTLGAPGLTLFFVPMLMIRNSAARYVELRAAQDHLVWNERMAAMGEMAAEIGHELSNALQVINARAQLLLTDSEGVRGERATHAIRVIFERVADMRRLTKGLMDFSHHDVLRRPEGLNPLVKDAVEFVSPQNHYDGVRWVVELDPSEPVADVDGGQLRQVLLNLFQNAVDAMAEAEAVDRWIGVATRARDGMVEIKVRDGGPGVPVDLRSRIFEPWFTTKPHGHGFGLAVSYRIIKNHGGSIEVRSHAAGGAEFVIVLPAHSEIAAQPRAAA
jgi:signal transduction histidine kinase